jgi:hypothetical protein
MTGGEYRILRHFDYARLDELEADRAGYFAALRMKERGAWGERRGIMGED